MIEIDTFIYQGWFKLIKMDDTYIYNVAKDFYVRYMLFFWTFYSSKEPEILYSAVFNITIIINVFFRISEYQNDFWRIMWLE